MAAAASRIGVGFMFAPWWVVLGRDSTAAHRRMNAASRFSPLGGVAKIAMLQYGMLRY
jgi:hypothetical protein